MTISADRWTVEPATGCWRWRGAIDAKGYGRLYFNGAASRLAHRIVYEHLVGPVPDGFELDHLCRNPRCVNPAHLEPVTHRVNCLRGVGPIPENAAKTHCVNGHPYDEANTYIRPGGTRDCRRCINERQRRYQMRKREAA